MNELLNELWDQLLDGIANEITRRVLAGLEKAFEDEAEAKAAQDQFDAEFPPDEPEYDLYG